MTGVVKCSISLGIAVLLLAVPAQAGKRKAVVRVVDQAPITVVGTGFAARERVTVRAQAGGRTFTKISRATLAGRFTVRFSDEAQVTECDPFSISATGGAGSRAMFTRKFQIPPPCGIAPQP